MASEVVIGTVPISAGSEICFYLDEFNGNRYANIRKFSKGERYTGPTRQGIKLTEEMLAKILQHRQIILDAVDDPSEEELCRIPKTGGRSVVVRFSLYEGKYGLDIRERYMKDGKEEYGKGIRIKIDQTIDAIKYMEMMFITLQSKEPTPYSTPESPAPAVNDPTEVPHHVKKYF